MRLKKYSSIQDDGVIAFKHGGQRVIFTYFKNFYVNRIQFEGLDARRKRPPPVIELDITKKGPEISETTSLYAQKARERLLGGEDVPEDFVEQIYAKDKQLTAKKNARKEKILRDVETVTFADVTFKPKTSKVSARMDIQRGSNSGNRGKDLFDTVNRGQYAEI